MSIKKNHKKQMRALFSRSKICMFFLHIAEYLYTKAEYSITGKIFSSYDEEGTEKGIIYRLIKRAGLERRVFRPVKRFVSRMFSESLLLERLNRYFKGFLYTKLSVYGVFAVTTGVGFLLIEILKGYALNITELSFLDLFVSLLLTVISVPLLFSSTTLTEAVCNSRTASTFVFSWFGCKKEAFEDRKTAMGHSRSALSVAMVLCVLSWWMRPVELIFAIAVLVFAISVLYIPESGIVGLVFLLPFLSSEKINCLIVYVAICFIFKYIRGKRTVRLDTLGITVLMFALFYTVIKLVMGDTGVVSDFWGYIGTFFLITNLIKSKKWIDRCMMSIIAASLLAAMYGCARYAANFFEIDYLIAVFKSVNEETIVSLFGSSSVFSQYLVLALPFTAVGLNSSKKSSRALAFIALLISTVCSVLTFEYRAWISILVGVVIFLLLYGKKTFAVMMAVLCAVPFAVLNIIRIVPESMTVLGTLQGNIADNIQGVFLSDNSVGRIIFGGAAEADTLSYGIFYKIISEAGLIGLVLFAAVLFFFVQKNITLYSAGCSKRGKLVSVSSVTAAMSILYMGVYTNVLASYSTSLMFWICLGIGSCIGVTERSYSSKLKEETEC